MKDPSKGGVYADCWHIPGGGIEKGETQQEALQREVREEVGIKIEPNHAVLIDDVGRGESIKKVDGVDVLCKMKFFVYRVDVHQPADQIEVHLNDDLVKCVWISLSELKTLKLTPPSIKLFTKLGYI